ncbi:uncharacterized protein (DUF58 family) [Alicyclobacillus sacchari]|uniref:Uncharacterized protein (DUF58 family) n=1 Tax=Alicyclobacillus sacchari TaxID=392010 RepID=A0A4R8LWM8_9BACL|nr:DUF58 domain-containing protein [Alicyclobacillus sacchari]TDY51096.1 uncharacterized protein (DUF58 family) [Alicyclobacillus sacchari]GMA56341.1 hypothetical protein GCM10025858_08440 [Alicyclobacillus sacchari]
MLALLWIPVLLILAVWVWPRAFTAGVHGKVACSLACPRHECDIGEPVQLQIALINRSFLPIPFAEIRVSLPPPLSFDATMEKSRMTFGTYILSRSRIDIAITVYGQRRGPATVADVAIQMHEGFGISKVYVSPPEPVRIAVRPNPLPLPGLRPPIAMQGRHPLERPLFPDETLIKGVRPYEHRDPAHAIHWRASARLGQLVSKQYFSATEPNTAIVLNAQTGDPFWMSVHGDTFEPLCGHALQAAREVDRAGGRILFATNAACGARTRLVVDTMPVLRIASLLAHAQPLAAADFGELLRALASRRADVPDQILVLSAYESPVHTHLLEQLRRQGKRVEVVRAPLEQATPHGEREEVSGK